MSNHSSSDERRHFKRIHFDCDAFIEGSSGKPQEVHLVDISLNGALISRPADWKTADGDYYVLRIELSGEGVEIRMECTIAHESEENIGVHCEHIDIDSAAHLRRIVELNLGDPELLNRELSALVQ